VLKKNKKQKNAYNITKLNEKITSQHAQNTKKNKTQNNKYAYNACKQNEDNNFKEISL
jgi:hypothetical protein